MSTGFQTVWDDDSNKQSSWLTFSCSMMFFVFLVIAGPVAATSHLDMFGVAASEDDAVPDKVLAKYLTYKVDRLAGDQRLDLEIDYTGADYSQVINKLVTAGDKLYLARTTPYVFSVAEMLGAKMRVLAVYESEATKTTTYNTYFVVNRSDFNRQPSLNDLVNFLQKKSSDSDPARFIYHNRFSTSSYFLPSWFFRESKVYSMEEPRSELIRIESLQQGNSSTALVKNVAAGSNVFAAVWDGTKAKFEPGNELYDKYGSKVYFVKLNTKLPNDLLVSASSLGLEVRRAIAQAIEGMTADEFKQYAGGRNLGDFRSWINIDAEGVKADQARQAKLALDRLRKLTRERTRPVVVNIQADDSKPVAVELVEAAKQAIKLSGTELAIKDDTYTRSDIVWRLRQIHDEAILLTSEFKGHQSATQTFQISYKQGDLNDFTKRVGNIIQSRLHRIRYIWPYKNSPTVIRDVPFSIDENVSVQKVKWTDPEKNDLVEYNTFDRKLLSKPDFNKFELSDFDPRYKDFNDPMSNVAYRVVLMRPEEQNRMLMILTLVYAGLMIVSAGFAVYDCRKPA